MTKQRKSFPLRISQDLFVELKTWAEQEMRSVNGQIEFLLRDAVNRRKQVDNNKIERQRQARSKSKPKSRG